MSHTVDEAEQEKLKKEFLAAAEPLALWLSTKHIADPIHQFVLADLYDRVNEIRDSRIKRARDLIAKFKACADFYYNPRKRTTVLNMQRIIRSLQGVVENEPSDESVQGNLQTESQGGYVCGMFPY